MTSMRVIEVLKPITAPPTDLRPLPAGPVRPGSRPRRARPEASRAVRSRCRSTLAAMIEQEVFARFLRNRKVLSPLRYPGGKRRLAPYVAAALAANDLRPDLLVAPFAGGASVSLELLDSELVGHVALGDADPMVAAFWRTVFEDTDWLCRQVESIPL